ncbi:MAG: hypothetical protein JWN98_2496, partial [Abditibacteriota bacterium]|nr:hypothetical protein [Abditibacteriota bacterium]
MPVATFLLWLLLVWGTGWLALPLARRIWCVQDGSGSNETSSPLFSLLSFPDAGLAAGRVALLVAWTLLMFWTGHLGLPVRLGWLLLLPIAALGVWLWWRERHALRALIVAKRRGIVAGELAFFLVFALFFIWRGFWPETGNGEKPMDIALIGACARADYLPPPNPYLAGFRLGGYYYFGHLQTALLTEFIGSQARWTYNLMCATLPALCFSVLVPLAGALTSSVRRGVAVAVGVLTLGTLEPLRQWFSPNDDLPRAWPFDSPEARRPLDYFSTSRVIPNPINDSSSINYTINEYPWFTFNYADLHAHYFAMPIALLVLSLAVALYGRVVSKVAVPLWLLAACGLAVGAQLVTNTWDGPAYFLVLAACLWPSKYFERLAEVAPPAPSSARAKRKAQRANRSTLPEPARSRFPRGALGVFAVGISTIVAASPYLLRLHTNANKPTPLDQPVTPLVAWLLMWGFFVGAWALSLGLQALREQRAFHSDRRNRLAIWGVMPVCVWLLLRVLPPEWSWTWLWPRPTPGSLPEGTEITFAFGRDWSVLIIQITLAIWTLVQALTSRDRVHGLLCRMACGGFFALLWSETTWAGFLGPSDTGPTFHRQDTVFKFGLQAWYLIGIAAMCGALRPVPKFEGHTSDAGAEASDSLPSALKWNWPRPALALWCLALPVLWSASIATTLFRARNFERFEGWDAWVHLAPPEREAAAWLQERARDGETLIEAEELQGGDYSP